ncbi:MAG: hypothetical protein ACKOD5_04455 [Chthoniobacterales bacterium]
MVKALPAILAALMLAGCATHQPAAGAAPRDVNGMKLEFADLHSTNTYEFLPGGRYRFTAVSQNGLRADRREGSFAYSPSGRTARISLDDETLHLVFEDPAGGTCTVEGDVRRYHFRLG